MDLLWASVCLLVFFGLLYPIYPDITIVLIKKRKPPLTNTEKIALLKSERRRLVAKSGGLLATAEQELPDSLQGPACAPRSPASPSSIILSQGFKNAIKRRREIADRINAIDRELQEMPAITDAGEESASPIEDRPGEKP